MLFTKVHVLCHMLLIFKSLAIKNEMMRYKNLKLFNNYNYAHEFQIVLLRHTCRLIRDIKSIINVFLVFIP